MSSPPPAATDRPRGLRAPVPPTAPSRPPVVVRDEQSAAEAARRLRDAPRIAVDLEANGMFAYRAEVCIMQLATDDEVVIVDTLAAPLGALADLLADEHVPKVVHDVSFDARLLAEAGARLANVRDTAVAARMLGRQATGLASLLGELGVAIDKKLQHHDWSLRPLDDAAIRYLAGDVAHLATLADHLFAEVDARAIGDAVEEETRYRLDQAVLAVATPDLRPPYVRLKGIDKVPAAELAILRHLAEIRERYARDLGVPPYKVLGPDVLFSIARSKPQSRAELERVPGATGGRRARAIADEVLDAVACGLEDEAIPEEDRVWFERPRLSGALSRARRAREQRLSRWRKEQAKARDVDEQVVLPGHCLQDLADLDEPSRDAVAAVAGLGDFRFQRDGDAILAALQGPARDDDPEAS